MFRFVLRQENYVVPCVYLSVVFFYILAGLLKKLLGEFAQLRGGNILVVMPSTSTTNKY